MTSQTKWLEQAAARFGTRCTPDQANKAAKILTGCFPDFGKLDPSYLVALVHVFEHYPFEIVKRFVDPFEGWPSKNNFLPRSTAEAINALNALISGERKASDEFAERARRQAVDRMTDAEFEAAKGSPERRREFLASLGIGRKARDEAERVRAKMELANILGGGDISAGLEAMKDIPDAS